jgi:hypothetical protein
MMIWANQIFGYHLFGKVRKNLFGGPLGKMGLEQLFVPVDFKALDRFTPFFVF